MKCLLKSCSMFAPTSCINTHMETVYECYYLVQLVFNMPCCVRRLWVIQISFFLKSYRDFENFHKKDWKFCSYCAYIPCNRENCDLCTVKEQSLDLFVCALHCCVVTCKILQIWRFSFHKMWCERLEGLVYISKIVLAFGFIWVTTLTQILLYKFSGVNDLKASFQLFFYKMQKKYIK